MIVVDLIEQIDNQVNPIPAIVTETIRSLNYCRRKGEESFIGCAQLLYIWIQSHFWGKCEASLRFCMSAMVPIREFCQKEWPKDQTREQWVATPRFGPDSRNMESPVDEARMCALRMWRQNMGPSIGFVGSCQLCSTTRVQTVCVETIHPDHSWT